jgi:ATP-dependent Clp protease ATP-binding subunit ClpC
MIENLGGSGSLALHNAERIAAELGHTHIGVEHLFLGIVELEDRGIQSRFVQAGFDVGEVARELRKRSGPSVASAGQQLLMTPRAQRVFEAGAREAASLSSDKVEAPHLLVALLGEANSLPVRVLADRGVDVAALAASLRDMLRGGDWQPPAFEPGPQPTTSSMPTETTSDAGAPQSILDEVGQDLTAEAKRGELHAAIGREAELLELIGILIGKKTPNAAVLGEAGVGKTALVRGLAVEIAEGDVPPELGKARIRSLEVGALVAGTVYRGSFEEKVRGVVRAAESDPNVIVFIDELHMLMGAGGSGLGDTVDAANLLKPALSGGKMRVIGATTEDEYQRHIGKDKALKRRFGVVRLKEPSPQATLDILTGLRARYQAFHDVTITDEALAAAVELSVRHLPDRFLPDKALDVIDKACTRKRLAAFYGQTDLGELSAEERRALFEGHHERAAPQGTLVVDADDVTRTVSAMSGVPVGKLTRSDAERLLGLEDQIGKRVIGQEQAIAAVAQSIRKSRAGIADENHPVGAFLFLGPTGTGKTELAKAIAEALFDDEDRMVRVDMGECYDKSSVSRLIGSPPGYVDSDRGGMLTDGIRRNPYTVVLLDEIEKADPAVHTLLLGMMDEGRITDAMGRPVDCRNAIIIMTSNVGSAQISEHKPFGFASGGDTLSREDVRLAVRKELSRAFPPEFINRFDEIVVFNPLTKPILKDIARTMLSRLRVPIEADDDVLEFLVDADYEPAMGARPLRRSIQDLVVEPLATEIVKGAVAKDEGVRLVLQDGAIVFEKPHATKATAEGTKAKRKPKAQGEEGSP